MKQNYLLLLTLGLSSIGFTQNSLLTDPVTAALPSGGAISDIEVIENGTDAVLVATNKTNKQFYAIDIMDNTWGDAPANTVTEIPDFQNVIDGVTGLTNAKIANIQVNGISKAVYVLATNSSGSTAHIVKITNDGANVELLDQSDMTYCTINWGAGSYGQQDMTWGDNNLYITSGTWTLDGEITEVAAPFTHDMTTTNRATSMYKTNWGGAYFTDAPVERLDYAAMNGEHRLMGVTVCAPGFSIETSEITSGGGVLEIEELFNINQSPPIKVVHQNQGGDHYLFDLHSFPNTLIRIGEPYIDGSQIGTGNFNNSAHYLRTAGGAVAPGFGDDEIKIYTNSFDMIAFWDDYNLLVLEDDVLKLFPTGTFTASTSELEIDFAMSPNPATDILNVSFNGEFQNSSISILSMDGKVLLNENVTTGQNQINVQDLASGNYLITLNEAGKEIYSEQLIIK